MRLLPGLNLTWSWRRASGLTNVKGHLSRAIGIPLTRSGQERKIGRALLSIFLPKMK